jgi:hypothetical protein
MAEEESNEPSQKVSQLPGGLKPVAKFTKPGIQCLAVPAGRGPVAKGT